jgi:hypothetical protein
VNRESGGKVNAGYNEHLTIRYHQQVAVCVARSLCRRIRFTPGVSSKRRPDGVKSNVSPVV